MPFKHPSVTSTALIGVYINILWYNMMNDLYLISSR